MQGINWIDIILILAGMILIHEMSHFVVAMAKKEDVDAIVLGLCKSGFIMGIVDYNPSALTMISPLILVPIILGIPVYLLFGEIYFVPLIFANTIGSIMDVYVLFKSNFGKEMKKLERKVKILGIGIMKIGSRSWESSGGKSILKIKSWGIKVGFL